MKEELSVKDLMINDWVNVVIEGEVYPSVITKMDRDTEDVKVAFLAVPGDWEEGDFFDEIQPIPLTSELLEYNGFKKFNFHDIEGQHQWSWWLDTLTSVSLWCRELNDDPKDGWMIRIESPLATCCHKVEYVHELQQTLRTCKIEKEITTKED